MYIHFIYVEHKENKITYLNVIKSENEALENKYINEILYKKIYLISNEEILNNNINYCSLFYIKKGFVIQQNDNTLWNNLLQIYMKTLNLLNLIDCKYIDNIKNENILLYKMNEINNDLYSLIIKLHLN
jgi:hypothetical protein